MSAPADHEAAPPAAGTHHPWLMPDQATLSPQEQRAILLLQQAILESVARGGGAPAVAAQVCRLAEQLVPNSVGSVMLLDKDSGDLNVFAAPGIPEEGVARLCGLRPGPGNGSCGNAVLRGEPQYVRNTFTDPRWQNLRDLAYDFNLCSCWSMPIRTAGGAVVGSFALSSFEHRLPSDFHRSLLTIGASIIGIVLDRDKAQESLRLLATAFNGSQEGMVITDLDGRILSVNPAFCASLGWTAEALTGQTPRVFASGVHGAEFFTAMWRDIRDTGLWRGEIWNRRHSGEIFPQWLTISGVRDADGAITHYIAIYTDISERKDAQARIQYLSSHDPVTDLPTRMLFADRFGQALTRAATDGRPRALLRLDIDNFKLFNDSLGQQEGDRLLREVADRLKRALSAEDTLSRLGGDEFLVGLVDSGTTRNIAGVVENLMEALAHPVDLQGGSYSLSCSVGVAVHPGDGDTFDALLKNGGRALQAAKAAGGNTCRFFTEAMNGDSLHTLRLAHDLRQAARRGQFVLHYQPEIDLARGVVVGVEALIRWAHPEEGLLPPARFIPVAEQAGLMGEIGEWVLNEACRQAMAWKRAGLPRLVMAVNVSATQFQNRDLVAAVQAALDASGHDASHLEIELTESVLLADLEQTRLTVGRLKGMGVRFAIDDFGTGYSSLAYLKKLRADRLKIDRSFIHDMTTDPDSAAIVRTIVQMGRTMHLRIIAEGVETAEDMDFLRACGCDEAQGYHLGRPMPADAFAEFMRATPPSSTASGAWAAP